jgi:thiamine biosynthesis lipoprotein
MKPVRDGIRPKLNFNAIAQGYSSDKIAAYLHSLGVTDMLVDIGEIYCEGLNPKGRPWRIGVDRPFYGNNTPGADLDGIWQGDGCGCGVVTSGNYRKYYEKDGQKYSHTIDPRTGYPVSHSLLSATIVAPNATAADAYATFCMVIGLDEAKSFITSRSDLEGYLIYDDNGEMKEWASSGFNLAVE